MVNFQQLYFEINIKKRKKFSSLLLMVPFLFALYLWYMSYQYRPESEYFIFRNAINTTFNVQKVSISESSSNAMKQNKLMFIHIPKTGGTLIELSAKQNNVYWGWQLFLYSDSNKLFYKRQAKKICSMYKVCTNNNSEWHIPLKWWIKLYHDKPLSSQFMTDIELIDDITMSAYYNLDRVDYFCIVRNPFSKIVSEYKYLGPKIAWIKKELSPLINIDNSDACHNEYILNMWIQRVLTKYKQMIQHDAANYCTIGCHFVKQYDFIYDSLGNQICKNILYFENFKEELSGLMSEYGLNSIYQTLSKTSKVHIDYTYCLNSSLSVSNLTNQTKQMIHEHYQIDFETFGYKY